MKGVDYEKLKIKNGYLAMLEEAKMRTGFYIESLEIALEQVKL